MILFLTLFFYFFLGQTIQFSFDGIGIECNCGLCPNGLCAETCNSLSACAYCPYDYVNIYDGSNFNSPLLLKACGSQIPPDVFSTGSVMYLYFVGDSSFSFKGFSATYYYYAPA